MRAMLTKKAPKKKDSCGWCRLWFSDRLFVTNLCYAGAECNEEYEVKDEYLADGLEAGEAVWLLATERRKSASAHSALEP